MVRNRAGDGAVAISSHCQSETQWAQYHGLKCNDAVAAYTDAAQWEDLLDLSIVPVLEDAEAGPVLAACFKK
jgi:hypothetical protein